MNDANIDNYLDHLLIMTLVILPAVTAAVSSMRNGKELRKLAGRRCPKCGHKDKGDG